MKKIILAFISIFTMLICIAQPLFVHAEGETLPATTHLEELEHTDGDIPSRPAGKLHGYESFRNGERTDTYFIYVVIKQKYDNIFMFHETYLSFENGTASFDDGVLDISNASSSYNANTHGRYSREMWSSNTIFYDDNYDGNHSFTNATFDFTNMSFMVQDNNGSVTRCNLSTSGNDNVRGTYNIYSNIPELLTSGSGLNLEVNFYPNLYGQVDRKIDGVTSEDFKIEIINHSLRTNAQCLMVICPTGQNVSFYDRTDYTQDSSISSVVSYNSLYTYLWWSDEWNYNYTSDIQTHFMHEHHPVASETFDVEKSLGPCPWHYVAADGIIRHSFAWSQINLEKFKSYTVYVYAMTLVDEVASRQAAFPTAPHFVDYDTIECVYSSEFTITNGYVYDMNNTAHGNYRSYGNGSSDSQMLGWSSKGTMDSNGNINIQSRTLQDYLDKHQEKMSNYTEAYIAPNWDGTPKVNVSSSGASTATTNYFDKFMRFVSYVFGRFPPSVQEIFIFGFVSVVVLGIILKVIK